MEMASQYFRCNYCGKPSDEECSVGVNPWYPKLTYVKKSKVDMNLCKEHTDDWLKYVNRKKGNPIIWEYSWEFLEMMR